MIKQNKSLAALFAFGLVLIAIAGYQSEASSASTARLVACSTMPENAAYMPSAQTSSYASREIYSIREGVAHSPTIIEHIDGSLQAVWFFGEDEAEPETGLASSTFTDGNWSEPKVLLTAESETKERGLFVNTIGNPLLVRASEKEVWLFYVTPSLGGWATSRISYRKSKDDGKSWGDAQLLRTSPFFNISSLVRQPAACLEDGNVALPLHFEFIGHYPKLAVLNEEGQAKDLRSMFVSEAQGLQPLVLTSRQGAVEAYLRPSSDMKDRVYRTTSKDGGIFWSDPEATQLPNPGAPVCGLHLSDGGTLIAFNDNPSDRRDFRLAFRSNQDSDWQRLKHEFSEGGDAKTYAYCSLIEDRSGRIHLVYSERKEGRIFHADFSQEWITNSIAIKEAGAS